MERRYSFVSFCSPVLLLFIGSVRVILPIWSANLVKQGNEVKMRWTEHAIHRFEIILQGNRSAQANPTTERQCASFSFEVTILESEEVIILYTYPIAIRRPGWLIILSVLYFFARSNHADQELWMILCTKSI